MAVCGVVLALSLAACAAPADEAAQVRVRTLGVSTVAVDEADEFACGGALEAATWALWDQRGLPFLRDELIVQRLQASGDTYALYDIQGYFDNLAALAQRCQRVDRMRQMADALMPLFDQLEPLPGNPAQRAWVCRGGAVCNVRNRLVNTEVMLVSVHGLGLLSHLAQMMTAAEEDALRHHPFVTATARVATQHVLRWGDGKVRADWRRLAQAKAGDVKDGSSALFLTDQPLWLIDVLSNLAGIYVARPDLGDELPQAQRQVMAGAMRDALQFFRARISFKPQPRLADMPGADVDAGFWRLYADSRYAGYTGVRPPAVCHKQPDGSSRAELLVDARQVPVVAGLGWDISHARRLVHVLTVVQHNRPALQQVFGVRDDALPAPALEQAFAAQLVGTVWNGDAARPLFTNYWSGANGWYRVAYDNGTGWCYPGYPPFGLSDAFTTGGYATWARLDPRIGALARTLFRLSQSGDEADKAFIRRYYGGLLAVSDNSRMLTQLMFWPTLIE